MRLQILPLKRNCDKKQRSTCLSGRQGLAVQETGCDQRGTSGRYEGMTGLGCSLLLTGVEGRTNCRPVTVTALPPAQLRRLQRNWFNIRSMVSPPLCAGYVRPTAVRAAPVGPGQAGKLVAPPLLFYVALVGGVSEQQTTTQQPDRPACQPTRDLPDQQRQEPHR